MCKAPRLSRYTTSAVWYKAVGRLCCGGSIVIELSQTSVPQYCSQLKLHSTAQSFQHPQGQGTNIQEVVKCKIHKVQAPLQFSMSEVPTKLIMEEDTNIEKNSECH